MAAGVCQNQSHMVMGFCQLGSVTESEANKGIVMST